ncbi:unnamed protein product [Closterium sp. Naga37s-1]|nr:unnamed protein product [Closterium sp. Naga37s-1]
MTAGGRKCSATRTSLRLSAGPPGAPAPLATAPLLRVPPILLALALVPFTSPPFLRPPTPAGPSSPRLPLSLSVRFGLPCAAHLQNHGTVFMLCTAHLQNRPWQAVHAFYASLAAGHVALSDLCVRGYLMGNQVQLVVAFNGGAFHGYQSQQGAVTVQRDGAWEGRSTVRLVVAYDGGAFHGYQSQQGAVTVQRYGAMVCGGVSGRPMRLWEEGSWWGGRFGMEGRSTVRLVVAYDGGAFHGYQSQQGAVTVQRKQLGRAGATGESGRGAARLLVPRMQLGRAGEQGRGVWEGRSTVRLVVAYDGGAFHGYQSQQGEVTVQRKQLGRAGATGESGRGAARVLVPRMQLGRAGEQGRGVWEGRSTVRLVVAYDGGAFHGYQSQQGEVTVQRKQLGRAGASGESGRGAARVLVPRMQLGRAGEQGRGVWEGRSTVRLVVAYDGGAFHGYQSQQGEVTVQRKQLGRAGASGESGRGAARVLVPRMQLGRAGEQGRGVWEGRSTVQVVVAYDGGAFHGYQSQQGAVKVQRQLGGAGEGRSTVQVVVAYDGGAFHGYQGQQGAVTVQRIPCGGGKNAFAGSRGEGWDWEGCSNVQLVVCGGLWYGCGMRAGGGNRGTGWDVLQFQHHLIKGVAARDREIGGWGGGRCVVLVVSQQRSASGAQGGTGRATARNQEDAGWVGLGGLQQRSASGVWWVMVWLWDEGSLGEQGRRVGATGGLAARDRKGSRVGGIVSTLESALAPFCEHHPKKQKGTARGQGSTLHSEITPPSLLPPLLAPAPTSTLESALAPFCEHHPKKQKGRARGQGGSKAWKERREKKGGVKRTGEEGPEEQREEGQEKRMEEGQEKQREEEQENGDLEILRGECDKGGGLKVTRAAVVVAGRTDKGVHAAGQVCAFRESLSLSSLDSFAVLGSLHAEAPPWISQQSLRLSMQTWISSQFPSLPLFRPLLSLPSLPTPPDTWKHPLDLTAVAAAADANMCYQPSPFSPLIPSPPLPVLTPPLQSDTWKDPLDLTAVAAAREANTWKDPLDLTAVGAAVDAATEGSLRVISISKIALPAPLFPVLNVSPFPSVTRRSLAPSIRSSILPPSILRSLAPIPLPAAAAAMGGMCCTPLPHGGSGAGHTAVGGVQCRLDKAVCLRSKTEWNREIRA